MNSDHLIVITWRHIMIIAISSMIIGLVLGYTLAMNNVGTMYSCRDIGKFHSDLLERNGFGLDVNTDNIRRDINRRASELNVELIQVCMTNPTL